MAANAVDTMQAGSELRDGALRRKPKLERPESTLALGDATSTCQIEPSRDLGLKPTRAIMHYQEPETLSISCKFCPREKAAGWQCAGVSVANFDCSFNCSTRNEQSEGPLCRDIDILSEHRPIESDFYQKRQRNPCPWIEFS